jgi:hypothetical protein
MKKANSLKTLVEEYVRQTFENDSLNEAVHMPETVTLCDGTQTKSGSSEHIADLQRTLMGLEGLKSHWGRGSSTRYLIGSTCARLRKLIAKCMANNGEVA